jgi:hypothetical protein
MSLLSHAALVSAHAERNAFAQLSTNLSRQLPRDNDGIWVVSVGGTKFSVSPSSFAPDPPSLASAEDVEDEVRVDTAWRRLLLDDAKHEGKELRLPVSLDHGKLASLSRVWLEPRSEDDWEIMVQLMAIKWIGPKFQLNSSFPRN